MEDLLPYDAKIINLVHDELVLEVKKARWNRLKRWSKGNDPGRHVLIKSVPIEVEAVVDKVWRK